MTEPGTITLSHSFLFAPITRRLVAIEAALTISHLDEYVLPATGVR